MSRYRIKNFALIFLTVFVLTGCRTYGVSTIGGTADTAKSSESEEDVTDAVSNETEISEEQTQDNELDYYEEENLQAEEPDEEISNEIQEEEHEVGDPVGAKIWAVMDIEILDEYGTTISTMKAGSSDYILSETTDQFEVSLGYVDKNYVMINLPDYLGDYVAYNITNSYSSVFTVHNNLIDGISCEVIPGYEDVCIESEEYYVPLLYPVAEQLYLAALVAEEYSYKLKIYDAYRPYEATRYLYDTVYDILYDEAEEGETYYQIMTNNGAYSLSAFLAQYTSAHNYGTALDITLVYVDDSDVQMQTSIHDLSFYSATAYNNENADTLAEIMTACGFDTLSSEWWHFQSDEDMSRLKDAGIDVKTLSLEY